MSLPPSLNRRDLLYASAACGGMAAVPQGGNLLGAATEDAVIGRALEQFRAAADRRRLVDGERLAKKETALIIVDMINLFCDPKWMSGGNPDSERRLRSEFSRIIPNLQRTLEAFREADALIVHVMNAKWTDEGREVVPYQRGRDYDRFDTTKMSVIDALKPLSGEIQIRKVTSSAFTATGLDFLLRNAGIKNVVLSGQYGNACVFYSLIQSREFGFDNYWLEDGLLYGNEASQLIFEPLVGAYWARLAATQTVIRALDSRADRE